jgi:hypothetical protein
MANYGYYYVVCLRNTGSKRKVLAHGMQRVDLDWCNSRGYDPAEEAMTDFWDGTEIPYSRGWRDYMWDQLERYVYLSDETDYKNRSWMPETDREVLLWVDLHGDEVILDEGYIKNKYEIWEWLDANGNNVSSSNQTTPAQSTSSANKVDYKTKIKKLLDYHVSQNQKRSVISWQTKNFNDSIDRVNFYHMEVIDNRKGPSMMREIAVMFFKQSQRWYIKVFVDGVEKIDRNGFKFNNLISDLSAYMALPLKNSQEYKDLLESAEIQTEVENYEHLLEWVGNTGRNFTTQEGEPQIDEVVDFKNCEKHFEHLVREIMRTVPSSGFSILRRNATSVWVHFDIGQWSERKSYEIQITSAEEQNGQLVEHWSLLYKQYKPTTEIIVDSTFKSYDDILDQLGKFGLISNGDECFAGLNEWVDSKGQKVNTTSSAPSPTPPTSPSTPVKPAAQSPASNPGTVASQPPVVAKGVKRRKQVKNRFGILIDNWGPELSKLGLEIWNTCKKPADEKDSGVGPSILRIYFEMPNGEEWRLEVTNTSLSLMQGLQVKVDWDYVISTDRNGSEVIISRGKTKDYNEFLDRLLGLGIISNKKNCV